MIEKFSSKVKDSGIVTGASYFSDFIEKTEGTPTDEIDGFLRKSNLRISCTILTKLFNKLSFTGQWYRTISSSRVLLG